MPLLLPESVISVNHEQGLRDCAVGVDVGVRPLSKEICEADSKIRSQNVGKLVHLSLEGSCLHQRINFLLSLVNVLVDPRLLHSTLKKLFLSCTDRDNATRHSLDELSLLLEINQSNLSDVIVFYVKVVNIFNYAREID